MSSVYGASVVVAGGTGNVGSFIVRSFLVHGARVVVPSRSKEKITELRDHLSRHVSCAALERLVTFTGDLSSQTGAARVIDRTVAEVGTPSAVVASLGRFASVPSLVTANDDDLRNVFDDYTIAHLKVARAFLPLLQRGGGSHVFINGPLAFAPWKDAGAGAVSVATAAQHMLFRSLAQELEGGSVELVELVVYSFVRGRETQQGSALPAEAVGEYAADIVARPGRRHGQTIHLRSLDVLKDAGVPIPAA